MTAAATLSGSSATSASRKNRISPGVRGPRFRAAPGPPLVANRSTVAPAASAIAADPSSLASSTTTISMAGYVCRRTDRTQIATVRARL